MQPTPLTLHLCSRPCALTSDSSAVFTWSLREGASGGSVTFGVGVAGASGTGGTAPTCHWSLNGVPLADGKRDDGTVVPGAAGFTLKLENVQPAAAGKYPATVTETLDAYDVAARALAPDKASTSATSTPATLTISAPTTQK